MMVFLWLILSVALGRDAASYLDQARFFMSKQLFEDALEQLELAVAEDDGSADPEAWMLLAQVRYQVCDVPGARTAAETARGLAEDAEPQRQSEEMVAFFSEQFGTVRLDSPRGAHAAVALTLETTLFDPDLKRYVGRLSDKLAKGPVDLPAVLGLPVGSYTINGRFVHVDSDEQTTFDPLDQAGPAARAGPALELGLGGTGWFGTNLGPAPLAELSASFHVGPLVVGPVLAWAPQPFQDGDGQRYVSATAVSGGVRIGYEIPGLSPLIVRPSVEGRVGGIPGIGMGCRNEGVVLHCVPGADRPVDVYASARVGVAGAELAFLVQPGDQPRSLGFGVKIGGDIAVGTLPRVATASTGGGEITFVVDQRRISAPALRAMGVVSIGL